MDTHYALTSCLWELTLKCNLRCHHCGSGAGRARRGELTLAECLALADEIVRLGCEELTLIGGEIFLYEGWHEVARRLSSRKVTVNLMSNGYHVAEKQIREIQHAGLSNVGISIDGMEAAHDAIRARQGAFAQVTHALDLLHEAGIPTGAVTSLLAFNLADLEPLYGFLVQHHVTLWQLQLVNPMGRMLGRQDALVKPKDIPMLTAFIREKNREREMLVVAGDSIGYHDENEFHLRGNRSCLSYWQGCQAGISSLFIDSVGNVKGCGALYADEFIEGNVRTRLLREIWEDPARFAYNRDFDLTRLTGRCARCDVGQLCRGGCRASNFFCTGSLYENAFCAHDAPWRTTACAGPLRAGRLDVSMAAP
jgi:radical SAM protein with 4Fe4S-binding SPASM domain